MKLDSVEYDSLLPAAFDWVMREIELPNNRSRGVLLETFLRAANEAPDKGIRMLERVWPEDARWPGGESYLRAQGWIPPENQPLNEDDDEGDDYDGPELIELLYHRLTHVQHRLFRDAQVRQALDPESPGRILAYTHACLNRFGGIYGDPCGLGVNRVIEIEEALRHMQEPAHPHPACGCTIDPYPN